MKAHQFATAASLLLAFLSYPAHARRAADCPGKTLEHAQCAWQAFERADIELNRVWAEINANFDPDEPTDAEMKQGLLRSQRAWVTFRDADCEGRVGGQMGNGTGRPAGDAICKEQMTVERTRLLLDEYGSP